MSRAAIPGLEKDIVAILRSRGFESLKARKDGSTTGMRKGRVSVHSRNQHPCISVMASHLGTTNYCSNDVELIEHLDTINRRENLLNDEVRKLADELVAHFQEKGVSVMLNSKSLGHYEVFTRDTTSSVKLFSLIGEIDRWDEIEIELHGRRNRTGPVATVKECLAAFKEWAEYNDRTATDCQDYEMRTLLSPEYYVYAMLYRGLKDISMIVYHVRLVSEDKPELQDLIDRHHNEDTRKEEHIAYKIVWVKNQLDCEMDEGLHA